MAFLLSDLKEQICHAIYHIYLKYVMPRNSPKENSGASGGFPPNPV